MIQRTIHLPESVDRIIQDKAKRAGNAPAGIMREYILEHMLSTDEIFICAVCDGHHAASEMSDEQDICVPCKAGV